MYKPHHGVIVEPNDIKIWRYLDLWKFEDLLKRKYLFFTRIDEFDDPFEGRSSGKYHNRFKTWGEYTYANCWHQNKYESNLMWQVYTEDFCKKRKNSKGIVIQSSFTQLCQCFKDSKCDQYIGKVIYDSSPSLGLEKNTLIPFFRKKNEFEGENEVRVIVQMMERPKNHPEKGIYINVNLTDLIEKIYISPYSPHGFIDEIRKVASKYNIDKPIEPSELYYTPTNNLEEQAIETIEKPNDGFTMDSSGSYVSVGGLDFHIGQLPYND